MNSQITYSSSYQSPITIKIGRDHSVSREGACLDIYMSRALAIDCPLTLNLLIRTDGTVVEWSAEFGGSDNTYWHLVAGAPKNVTPEQVATLAKIMHGQITPFGGVRGGLGRTVTDLFAGYSRKQIEEMGGVTPGSVAYNS